MNIWVDADACPKVIKEILFRAAERVRMPLYLVSNSSMRVPSSPYISLIKVPAGFDMTDDQISDRVLPGDLVVTADIPLAAAIIARGAFALNPRGDFYSEDNIADHLATRDLMDNLRSSGVISGGGPPPFTKANRTAFANQLDRFLAKIR